MKRILVTGPGGRIGPHLLPRLRPHYRLRLFDLKRLRTGPGEEMVVGDIRDREAFRRACQGMDALVHLAAVSDEADFDTRLLPANLEGGYNAFEAARLAGVPRVIFASTGQATVNYPERQIVTTDMPARPCTVYACTKLFGEALGRFYADHHDLAVVCLRICWFQDYDSPLLRIPGHRIQHQWCSPRDLAHLIIQCLESDLKWGVFYGLSNNRDRCWDIDNAREQVGYQPEDDASTYLKLKRRAAGAVQRNRVSKSKSKSKSKRKPERRR